MYKEFDVSIKWSFSVSLFFFQLVICEASVNGVIIFLSSKALVRLNE